MEANPVSMVVRSGDRIAFRSKLEARWSIYFDIMGFHWEYEPPREHGYTPDFIVDEIGVIEVKPSLKQARESAKRIGRYVKETGLRVYLFYGQSAGILHGVPLQFLKLSAMQQNIILAGEHRRKAAIDDYPTLAFAVRTALNSALKSKLYYDGLAVGEVLTRSDTRTHPSIIR
jgi:hypothetical protein